MWTGRPAISPETYTIDVSNESMIGGPEANPSLARKMAKVYKDVGLVLLRGAPEIGNDLEIGKKWVTGSGHQNKQENFPKVLRKILLKVLENFEMTLMKSLHATFGQVRRWC